MIKKLFAIVLILSMTACATYRPIVDMRGKSQAWYEYDLKQCQEYAKRINTGTSAAVGAGVGAGIGAIMGGIVGAFFGCTGRTAAFGAALGGATGGIQGAGEGARSQKEIICRCMRGRGWNVLH